MPAVLSEFHPARNTPTAELLALEETLLLRLNENPPSDDAQPFLLFFEPTTPAVVLGTGQKHREVVDRAACERDGVPILRRPSGGGCVFHAPGVLWFSLGVPFTWLPSGATGGIRTTFAEVLKPICTELQQTWKIAAQLQGICDIAVAAIPTAGSGSAFHKLAGSAQCRKQRAVLVHGTLLVSANLAAMEPYLPIPEKQPEYRAGRSHRDFLTTLVHEAPTVAVPALCEAIAQAWVTMLAPQVAQLPARGTLTRQARDLSTQEMAAARMLAQEKYTAPAWTYRL